MKKIFFLMGILLPLAGYCQNSDTSNTNKKLTTTAPFLGGVSVSDLVTSTNTNENTFTIQQPIADIGFPVYKNFSTGNPILLKAGIRYQGLYLSGEQSIGSNAFHSITVPLLFNYSFSRKTSISFVGIATAGSDFKRNISAEDILYTVGIRLGFRSGQSFRYGITLAYMSNYTGKFILPLPDIDWAINSRLSFAGIIPARASLKYKLSAAQSLGITASLNGSLYRLNDNMHDQYIHLRQSSGGLIYDLKIARRWKFNLIAGHTFSQRLETFNLDQKVSFNGFTKLNDRIANISYRQNSFLFQGGLSYEF